MRVREDDFRHRNITTMLNFKELQSLVARVTNPTGGQFYRNLYKMSPGTPSLKINSMEEWYSLPFVTKEDLSRVSLKNRLFIPMSQVDHLAVSSGTSGKPPVFNPHTDMLNMEYRLKYHDFKNAFLVSQASLPHWHEIFQRSNGLPGRVIVFDPKNPKSSIILARAAGVDGMSLFTNRVQIVGEVMKKEKINKRIRLIEMVGELCPYVLYEYMRATFPNATILSCYGAQEVEDCPYIGIPCKPMDGSEPLAVYHSKKTHYLEIRDPETGKMLEPKKGVEGELVVTAYQGETAVFPLLRFRIGDTIRVMEEKCPHGAWSFTILGRTSGDFLRIVGGELRADEITRVLRLFPGRISDLFQLHCYTKKTSRGPLLLPVLQVDARGEINFDTLARDIENTLRTGPSFTYGEGVKEGRYLPMRCEILNQENDGKKHKRIVVH